MKYVLFAVVVALAAPSARADDIIEYGCAVLAQKQDGTVDRILPETKVLAATRSPVKFGITLPPGYSHASVQCFRSDFIPEENDWKVIWSGYPLYISERQTRRGIVLELSGGQVRVRLLNDVTLSADEKDRLQKRINQLQTSMQNADSADAARE